MKYKNKYIYLKNQQGSGLVNTDVNYYIYLITTNRTNTTTLDEINNEIPKLHSSSPVYSIIVRNKKLLEDLIDLYKTYNTNLEELNKEEQEKIQLRRRENEELERKNTETKQQIIRNMSELEKKIIIKMKQLNIHDNYNINSVRSSIVDYIENINEDERDNEIDIILNYLIKEERNFFVIPIVKEHYKSDSINYLSKLDTDKEKYKVILKQMFDNYYEFAFN